MNIVLINPPFARYGGTKGQGGSLIPLNLCCLAAYLRQQQPELNLRILDAEVLGLSHEAIIQDLSSQIWDLICITTTTASFDSVISLCGAIRAAGLPGKIVLGGPHVSGLAEDSLRESGADLVVIGEGELTLWDIVKNLQTGSPALPDIPGIAYFDRETGTAKRTAPRELIADLDSLPFPARDLVDNTLYSPPPTKRVADGANTMVSTSRGCPHQCGFCGAQTVWGRKIRFRSAASVVAEINECVTKYGIRSINFTDEFFTAIKKRTLEICGAMKSSGLNVPWVCSARAQNLDDETLEAMREAGCREISFGIESGNPAILQAIDKHLDLKEAETVIHRAKRHGISTHASYILGYIGETPDSIRDTIRVAKQMNTDIAAFFVAVPLPGTRLYQEAKQAGYIRADASWKDYSPLTNAEPVMRIPTITTEELVDWHRRATRGYYLRPSYILRRLLRLRHAHEMKNLIAGLKILISFRRT